MDISVATFARMFPHVAKKTRRLIGFRKKGNHKKVVTMNVEPRTEKTDVVRVATSMARILPADSCEAMSMAEVRLPQL